MAHWGIAISYYHQVWDPHLSANDLQAGTAEIQKALDLSENASEREQAFIHALSVFYLTAARTRLHLADLAYVNAMREAASQNPDDTESQVFYALSFLAIASPADPAHTNQKWAAQILGPLYERFPDHPGIAHYLIHAYDAPDLAPLGLPAARAYAKIAPSAPHALHMPSHIFTLLGLWRDSIASNLAARAAAHSQGDVGEEFHAMDYLLYAYLQNGNSAKAEALVSELRELPGPAAGDNKIAYAATVMRVRYAIERRDWQQALSLSADPQLAPQFRAICEWGNAVAAAHLAKADEAQTHAQNLQTLSEQMRGDADDYWIAQVQIQAASAQGWAAHARGDDTSAIASLGNAADTEDQLAKRPITPGPVTPAREQLADLFLELNQPAGALREYETVLKHSPGRRNALSGAVRAAELSGDTLKAAKYGLQLKQLQ